MRWLIQWDEITQRLISFFRSTFQFVEDAIDTCRFQRKISNQERIPNDAWNKRYTVPVADGWGAWVMYRMASSPAVLLQSAIGEGNWAELTFAQTSGTVVRDREKNWPIADRRIPSNDPRNTCGTRFGSSSLLIFKVSSWVVAIPRWTIKCFLIDYSLIGRVFLLS